MDLINHMVDNAEAFVELHDLFHPDFSHREARIDITFTYDHSEDSGQDMEVSPYLQGRVRLDSIPRQGIIAQQMTYGFDPMCIRHNLPEPIDMFITMNAVYVHVQVISPSVATLRQPQAEVIGTKQILWDDIAKLMKDEHDTITYGQLRQLIYGKQITLPQQLK